MPESVTLYAIGAQECEADIDKLNILATINYAAHESLDPTSLCIEWYTYRWVIEKGF